MQYFEVTAADHPLKHKIVRSSSQDLVEKYTGGKAEVHRPHVFDELANYNAEIQSLQKKIANLQDELKKYETLRDQFVKVVQKDFLIRTPFNENIVTADSQKSAKYYAECHVSSSCRSSLRVYAAGVVPIITEAMWEAEVKRRQDFAGLCDRTLMWQSHQKRLQDLSDIFDSNDELP